MNEPNNKLILLVDDSIEHQLLIREIFQTEGYQVLCAGNGQEALNLLNSPESGGLPAFILLDLMMPVMDGFQFRTAQLADPKIAKIPVVIMTADGQIVKEMLKLKAEGYLRKPVDIERLLETAKTFCGPLNL